MVALNHVWFLLVQGVRIYDESITTAWVFTAVSKNPRTVYV